jgi:CHRD domain
MKKLIVLIAVIVTVIALSGIAQGGSGTFAEADFKAELSGAAEVPPVETDTTGEARFIVRGDSIDFELEIANAENILGVAGGHIHCAPAGVNGPVVAFLAGPVAGGFDGSVEVKATLTAANITNTACGTDIAGLVESMRLGRAYVNVHSPAHPGGEARGQIVEI